LQWDLPPSPPHLSSRTTSGCNSVWCDTFRRKLSALPTLNIGAVASLSIFVSTKLHRVMYQDCNILWIWRWMYLWIGPHLMVKIITPQIFVKRDHDCTGAAEQHGIAACVMTHFFHQLHHPTSVPRCWVGS
jgi:hypothetical protein